MTDAPAPQPILPQTPAAASTMRRDLISAYAASGAKIGSWVILSSFVYRFIGRDEFAVFAFVRGTLGILNYLAFGLGPAMVRLMSESRAQRTVQQSGHILDYVSPQPAGPASIYATGALLGLISTSVGIAVVFAYAHFFEFFSAVSTGTDTTAFIILLGIGLILRLVSDVPGAVLQTHGEIAIDNGLAAAAELLWVALVYMTPMHLARSLLNVGLMYLIASLSLVLGRAIAAATHVGIPDLRWASNKVLKQLAVFGGLVVIAQLADFLYSPTDYLLINALIHPAAPVIADYAPAVQIDSGLLVIVAGLSSVLLPRAALAHVTGDLARVRRYYVVGTTGSAALISGAAILLLVGRNQLFHVWFHSPMPGTQGILPLVLIHTVIGGSSAVGRSILLGMGKVKPFTIAVLFAGVSNVILSYVFARYLHLGLRGIIYGTIIAVVGRCAIWMPWYVLRSLRESKPPPAAVLT